MEVFKVGMMKDLLMAVVDSANEQHDRKQSNMAKKSTAVDVKSIKHNKVPDRCPSCLNSGNWRLVGTPKKGFSVGKATVGALLVGPIGVAGGALGKKKQSYHCSNCGFSHVYDK